MRYLQQVVRRIYSRCNGPEDIARIGQVYVVVERNGDFWMGVGAGKRRH
jgi:hypothetical protein